jgi:hypothetical protein
MKLNLDKILNIKTKRDLESFNINKPIFYDNYLFHYLITLDKLDILQMAKFPVFKLNEEGLDGFMLAAKYNNMKILKYLIKEYPEYCQNHNEDNLGFINFLENPEKIIPLMKEFPKVDWYYLLKFKDKKSMEFYSYFISILDFDDLDWLLKNFDDSKRFNRYYLSSAIIENQKIKDKDKINIFNKFSDEDINVKDLENNGLIINLIDLEDPELTKYFISRNLDLEYIIKPITSFITPFFYLYTKLNLMNNSNLIKIAKIIWNKIKLDFSFVSKEGIDYLGLALTISNDEKVPLLDEINEYILKNSPEYSWNRVNQEKMTNLFLLIKKPFDKYHKYVKDKKLDISVKDKDGNTILEYADPKWKEFLLKSEKYKPDLKLHLDENKYQHYTKFTATLIDIIIYFIHLDKKHKNLYIPKINKGDSNNFPWFINFNSEENILDIHPNLNFLINNVRRDKSHDYGIVFLSLTLEDNLKHANILLYDFKNLTVERFEPYGDNGIDEIIDEYLEEELTWNTGLKYLRPKDFLTKPGYQLISNEGSENLKAGDFGGFCLGWCLWYIEHRMKNSNIDPKSLNKKTIEKMLHLQDSFTEFIRNYSNKLFDYKFKIIKNISIPERNISNLYLSLEDENKIIDYAENFFTAK